MLQEKNLYLGGDSNLTLSSKEILGSTHQDPLADFFNNLFRNACLLNISPVPLSSTWCNGRQEDQGIAKRIDHFLISDFLAEHVDCYRVFHINSKVSDHFPICLQFDLEATGHNYPYKFNHHSLDVSAFQSLVREYWSGEKESDGLSAIDRMSLKLQNLKGLVKCWDTNIRGIEHWTW